MSTSDLAGIDFAALRTLRLVHELKSFTAAAEALGCNQSAVSYTIDKLRKVFGDKLFFRHGRTLMVTARCEEIVEEAERLIGGFEMLIAPPEYDPASATASLTIACNHYERHVILPPVIRKLRQAAPGLRLECINASVHGTDQLKRGDADLLIGPIRPDSSDFFCRKLLTEEYVCLMDKKHPLAGRALDIAAYADCAHVEVVYGAGWQSKYLNEIDALGLQLNSALTLPSPASLKQFLVGTDLVATLPRRLAQLEERRLHVAECPVPASFDIDLVWTTRTHGSAIHKWLRSFIVEAIQTGAK